ncbi:peroxiredoxin [Bradyrhizobium roseum]|uniref:peroxiredoxin n=1 Tax=Bradyrhizobium roseum TaxID=3056648 RepID=UPI002630C900|nr:redoxin domain-containing protein [Bradyrhizobium roseus]WKA25751.1 redoxin domain-containing protein [Bradyrhizobium roseus]
MSKKTRKKSSKPAPKSRKTPARKPPVAKTASKTARTAAKKPAAKTSAKPAAKTAGKPARPAAKATVSKPVKAAKSASIQSSHKPTSKKLIKSNQSAPPAPVAGTEMVVGAVAWPFSLPRNGGGHVSLADHAGKKLVLFFYPRADTPGCTREAIDFTRLESAFADAGAAVLGISADTVKAQESFSAKHQLSVPLISDEQHEMLEAYGAWGEKSMYGRSFMGIIRTTVLIGADGRVARIWRNVRVDGHAEEVLAAVQAM